MVLHGMSRLGTREACVIAFPPSFLLFQSQSSMIPGRCAKPCPGTCSSRQFRQHGSQLTVVFLVERKVHQLFANLDIDELNDFSPVLTELFFIHGLLGSALRNRLFPIVYRTRFSSGILWNGFFLLVCAWTCYAGAFLRYLAGLILMLFHCRGVPADVLVLFPGRGARASPSGIEENGRCALASDWRDNDWLFCSRSRILQNNRYWPILQHERSVRYLWKKHCVVLQIIYETEIDRRIQDDELSFVGDPKSVLFLTRSSQSIQV